MTLIHQNISCLKQTSVYLKALSNAEYQQPLALLSGSTIGQHTRHFIEFYQCLLLQAASGEVNYDLRRRDYRIESDPEFANSAILAIVQQLDQVDLNQTLLLETGVEAKIRVSSNAARELLYNLEHCIHHLAIIKIGLAILKPDLVLPSDFGLAASTIQHRKEQLRVAN